MATATLPAFLSARADVAARVASELALPAKRDEAWRRTSLEGLEPDQYKAVPAQVKLIGEVPEGVVFAPLLDAAQAHNELLRTYLGTLLPMDLNKLTALQAAHLTGGVFLYVPPGVTVKEPLQVIYTTAAGEAQYVHTVVVAGANSSVTLLERYAGEGDYLSVGAVELFALDNARVRYGYLQNQSQDSWSFLFRRGRTARGAELDWVGGEFGGSLVRSEIVTTVEGEGSESNIKLVFGANERQHIDIVANETH
ncbi:MAG: SufD family Fe-S cluster assembly protein, partial [Mycobacterium leprae]